MLHWLTPLAKIEKPEKHYTLVYGERRSDPEKRRQQMSEAMARYRARKKAGRDD